MPRVTPADLVQQITILTREGHNQSEVARRLGIQQPRVSKIMRAHGIATAQDARYIAGSTRYQTPRGEVHICVQSFLDGKPLKTVLRASPEQLHDWAIEAARMLNTPCPCPTHEAPTPAEVLLGINGDQHA